MFGSCQYFEVTLEWWIRKKYTNIPYSWGWPLSTHDTEAMVTIGFVNTFSEAKNIEYRSNPLRNSVTPIAWFDIQSFSAHGWTGKARRRHQVLSFNLFYLSSFLSSRSHIFLSLRHNFDLCFCFHVHHNCILFKYLGKNNIDVNGMFFALNQRKLLFKCRKKFYWSFHDIQNLVSIVL